MTSDTSEAPKVGDTCFAAESAKRAAAVTYYDLRKGPDPKYTTPLPCLTCGAQTQVVGISVMPGYVRRRRQCVNRACRRRATTYERWAGEDGLTPAQRRAGVTIHIDMRGNQPIAKVVSSRAVRK
jgi:hypothetical protein